MPSNHLILCCPLLLLPSVFPSIIQARILEWVAKPSSRGSSQRGDRTTPRGEALFRCARPSGVPRGPANSTGSLTYQRHHGKFPKVLFDPWVRKIPWSRKWQPTPVFLPGESRGKRSLTGYSPWQSLSHEGLRRSPPTAQSVSICGGGRPQLRPMLCMTLSDSLTLSGP